MGDAKSRFLPLVFFAFGKWLLHLPFFDVLSLLF